MKMKSRKLCLVAMALGTVVLLGGLTSQSAKAQQEVPTVEEVAALETKGAAADLVISSDREYREFAKIVNNGNSFKGKVVKLANDITFQGVDPDECPMINGFAGTFDGCGHTISNVKMISTGGAGLFGGTSGVIKNVTVKNSTFSSTYVGSSSGSRNAFIGGIVANLNGGSISNCHVIDCTITGGTYCYTGGVVGVVQSGTVKNCSSNSIVTSGEGSYCGGIVGSVYNYKSSVTIVNCCNTGAVGSENTYSAGICEWVSSSSSVKNCFNTGKVTGYTDRTAGIVVIVGCLVVNSYSSTEAAEVKFCIVGNNVNISTCKDYPASYMSTAEFVNQLNTNRSYNTDWFLWELRGDSSYPLPVKVTNLANCNVALAAGNYVYNGQEQTPAVAALNGNYALVQGQDYTVTYDNNVNAGTATAVISGDGMYTGDVTINFVINKANPSFTYLNSVAATDGVSPFALGVGLSAGNGVLEYTSSDTKVAKIDNLGTVTVTGPGRTVVTTKCAATRNYKEGQVSTVIMVKPKQQTVSLKVKGNKLTIKWKKDSKVTGYQVQYANDKKFKKKAKTIQVKKNSKNTRTISKLKRKKTYYVRVRSYKTITVNGKKKTLTGAWSAVKKASR
jgi:hypothetical protein